mgnify:FL=1
MPKEGWFGVWILNLQRDFDGVFTFPLGSFHKLFMSTPRKDDFARKNVKGTPLGGKMLERLVSQVIFDNTQPSSPPSEEATRSLFKYLCNPDTKDLGKGQTHY